MKSNSKLICIFLAMFFILELALPFGQRGYAAPVDERLVGAEKVAETDSLILYYNEEEISIYVLDKHSGFLWSSVSDESKFDSDDLNDEIDTAIRSLFLLTYTDLTKDADNISTRSYLRLKSKIDREDIENGIKLTFEMEELKTQIVLEIFLEDDLLKVRIPSDGIVEGVGIEDEIGERIETINGSLDEIRKKFDEVKKVNIPEIKKLVSKAETDLNKAEERSKQIKNIYGLSANTQRLYTYMTYFRNTIMGSRDDVGIIEELEKMGLESKKQERVHELCTDMYDLGFQVMSNSAALKGVSIGGVVEIDLLPYFGAGYTGEEGYVLYPDGSGAITHFSDDPRAHDQFYSKEVYSGHNVDLNEHDLNRENGIKDIMLPVYGIKRDDHAFVGFISEGEADSTVNFYPAGYRIDINRGNFGFVYRRSYKPITKSWSGLSYQLIERERLDQDREVAFAFLSEEDASYSGMASRYREHLLDAGSLKKSNNLDGTMPLGLDILMGIKEKRVLKDKFIDMTTFDQATDMLKELKQEGIDDIQVNLMGWMKDGFWAYPSKYKLEGKLGGNRDFKRLVDTIKENKYTLYLQDNLIDAYRENGRFSIGKDAARDRNTSQISDKYKNRYIYSPAVALRRLQGEILPASKKFDVDGIAFEKLGSFIYSDTNKKYPSTRQETTEHWNEVVKSSKEGLSSAASLGGNLYVLDSVDRLINIPNETTGYFITDESVPFYQLVVHGYIPYSSKPFNLFYDTNREKLKAIEYGCIPYYQLTYEDSEELIYTSYNRLFTSKFDDWKQEVIESYREFNENLGDTVDVCMVEHQKVGEDLYKVTYENGVRVYVNYSSKAQKVDDVLVDPNNYTVVKNGR